MLDLIQNIYFSLVYSHMIYAIEVWGSAFKTEIHKVFCSPKHAIRLITRNENANYVPGPLAPSNPNLRRVCTLKVSDIYKYQISKFIFKCLYQLGPINFQNWFIYNREINRYHTRTNIDINNEVNLTNLFVPYARTTNYGLKQIKADGPRIWNAIPNHIKTITSLNVFLKNLKTYLLTQYI